MTTTDPHLRLDDDDVDGGAQLAQIIPGLGALVAEVGPAEMRLSTPCEGWITRDLLNHLVGGAHMFAEAFAGAPLRELVAEVNRFAHIVLDPWDRNGVDFQPATSVPPGASAIDHLVGFTGRTP